MTKKNIFFLSSPLGHIRDPNNQMQAVKNLRICVNNVSTSLNTASTSLSSAQCRMLNEVVLSCQPQEGALTNVITAGDYDLNFSGKKSSRSEIIYVWEFVIS